MEPTESGDIRVSRICWGLNLTAADYVIILDPWWNPAVENQAADRAHRIGQSRPVTIYRLIARDTVEERVLALHKEKRDLAADMLDGTGSSHLNSEILMGLLQGPEGDKFRGFGVGI